MKESEILPIEKVAGYIGPAIDFYQAALSKIRPAQPTPSQKTEEGTFLIELPWYQNRSWPKCFAFPLFSLGLVFFVSFAFSILVFFMFLLILVHGILGSVRVKFHLSCKGFKHDLFENFPSFYGSYGLEMLHHCVFSCILLPYTPHISFCSFYC